ncbi:hypothetical protein [Streptomyces sp. NPDC091259]|uniref:hypothetical protein n=1 Tax=Streptomyces sp. NPDC091259 TaxID=3365976 RepID=UPI00382E3FF0
MQDLEVEYDAVELDQMDDGADIQDHLESTTKQRSVPNIDCCALLAAGRTRQRAAAQEPLRMPRTDVGFHACSTTADASPPTHWYWVRRRGCPCAARDR